jgi:hypothetical protein
MKRASPKKVAAFPLIDRNKNGNCLLFTKINPCTPHKKNAREITINPIKLGLKFELLERCRTSFIFPEVISNINPINDGRR